MLTSTVPAPRCDVAAACALPHRCRNVNVRFRKFCKTREAVQRQLFAARSSFSGTLRLVQSACFGIRDSQLLRVEPRRLYALPDFEAEQLAVRVHGEQQVVQAIE